MKTKMSLTKEQKKDLDELSRYFKKVEKLAEKNNLDLDVFISEYKDNGYAIYATEQVQLEDGPLKVITNKEEQKNTSAARKKVFVAQGKEKSEKVRSKH